MEVTVISLERTPERLREFTLLNARHLKFSVFPAIDGSQISPELLVQNGLFDGSLRWKPGAIGLALSHATLWKTVASCSTPITVCEDDAIFHPNFEKASSELIASLPSDWDLVMWGWNFDAPLAVDLAQTLCTSWATFDQESLRKNVPTFLRTQICPNLYKLRNACGTLCYSISASGAAKFLVNALPFRKMHPDVTPEGIDITMNHFYGAFNCHVAIPPLVVTMNDKTKSTVNPSAPAVSGESNAPQAVALAHAGSERD